MTKLIDIEGIGATYAAQLKAVGIQTTEAFLTAAATRKGRAALAEKTGISAERILDWANCCDLYRIKGIGSEYSQLLERAGVDTVAELAHRNPAKLSEQIAATNLAEKLVRRLPTSAQVADWIEQAKALPRVLEY